MLDDRIMFRPTMVGESAGYEIEAELAYGRIFSGFLGYNAFSRTSPFMLSANTPIRVSSICATVISDLSDCFMSWLVKSLGKLDTDKLSH